MSTYQNEHEYRIDYNLTQLKTITPEKYPYLSKILKNSRHYLIKFLEYSKTKTCHYDEETNSFIFYESIKHFTTEVMKKSSGSISTANRDINIFATIGLVKKYFIYPDQRNPKTKEYYTNLINSNRINYKYDIKHEQLLKNITPLFLELNLQHSLKFMVYAEASRKRYEHAIKPIIDEFEDYESHDFESLLKGWFEDYGYIYPFIEYSPYTLFNEINAGLKDNYPENYQQVLKPMTVYAFPIYYPELLETTELMAQVLYENNFAYGTFSKDFLLRKAIFGKTYINSIFNDTRNISETNVKIAKLMEKTMLDDIEKNGYTTRERIIQQTNILSAKVDLKRAGYSQNPQKTKEVIFREHFKGNGGILENNHLKMGKPTNELKQKFNLIRDYYIIYPA
ncbi:hypothetical protein CMETHOX_04560 [Lacrimispora indolis]|nr:hypothetical protein CMETHOX_04560 [[Clostridium] methoxybenzovorans]